MADAPLSIKPAELDKLAEKIDANLDLIYLRAFDVQDWPTNQQTGCWDWTGHIQNKDRTGKTREVRTRDVYNNVRVFQQRLSERPMVWFRGKLQTAQRVVFRVLVKELAEHESLKNWCGNRRCVNPTHYRMVWRKPHRPKTKAQPAFDEDVIDELAPEIERIYAIHQPGAWAELYDHFKEEFTEVEIHEALRRVGGVVEERCSPVVDSHTELSANY